MKCHAFKINSKRISLWFAIWGRRRRSWRTRATWGCGLGGCFLGRFQAQNGVNGKVWQWSHGDGYDNTDDTLDVGYPIYVKLVAPVSARSIGQHSQQLPRADGSWPPGRSRRTYLKSHRSWQSLGVMGNSWDGTLGIAENSFISNDQFQWQCAGLVFLIRFNKLNNNMRWEIFIHSQAGLLWSMLKDGMGIMEKLLVRTFVQG